MSYGVVTTRSAVTVVRAAEALVVRLRYHPVRAFRWRNGESCACPWHVPLQVRTVRLKVVRTPLTPDINVRPVRPCRSPLLQDRALVLTMPTRPRLPAFSGRIDVRKEDVRTVNITRMKFDSQVYGSLQEPAIRGGTN